MIEIKGQNLKLVRMTNIVRPGIGRGHAVKLVEELHRSER